MKKVNGIESLKEPNFFIVGAAKAGTTTLYQTLAEHPDVFLPRVKEPHFFASDQAYSFPIIENETDYFNLFENVKGERAIGEASTAYLYFSGTAKKIKRRLPKAKIIIMLRKPSAIAFSMWGHQVRQGLELMSFTGAINQELEQGHRQVNGVSYGFNYLRQAQVSAQVQEYLDHFGAEQVLIGDFDELRSAPGVFMKQVCEFLDVDPNKVTELSGHFNPSGKPKSPLLHRLLNNSAWWRRALVAPLKLVLTEEQRHKLWNRLRDKNILSGQRHDMDTETQIKLDELFKTETEQRKRLIASKNNNKDV